VGVEKRRASVDDCEPPRDPHPRRLRPLRELRRRPSPQGGG